LRNYFVLLVETKRDMKILTVHDLPGRRIPNFFILL